MNSATETTPFLSIILPTYNVEKYIDRCIESCINQTFDDIEIVVVDDCGSDNSIHIAECWAKRDQRVRVIKYQENQGTFLARKIGVKNSRGRYVLFLDPDDSLELDTVKTLYLATQNDPKDIIFFGLRIVPKPHSLQLSSKLPANSNRQSNILSSFFCDIRNPPWGIAGKMYARHITNQAFEKLEFVEHRLVYAEDTLFIFAAAAVSSTYLSIDKKFYIHYKNPESITEAADFNTLKENYSQVTSIISHVKFLSMDRQLRDLNGCHLVGASAKVSRDLESTRELIFRNSYDPDTLRPLYLKSILASHKAKPRLSTFIKVFMYYVTAFRLKL